MHVRDIKGVKWDTFLFSERALLIPVLKPIIGVLAYFDDFSRIQSGSARLIICLEIASAWVVTEGQLSTQMAERERIPP
jgi:hypothetical protein